MNIRIVRLSVSLLLFVLVPISSAAGQPLLADEGNGQGVDPPRSSSHWARHFEQQVKASLSSPVKDIQNQTMQLIVWTKDQEHLDFELNIVVPRLLAIYKNEKTSEKRRLLALNALAAIENPEAMRRLRTLVNGSGMSPHVQKRTRAVLQGASVHP